MTRLKLNTFTYHHSLLFLLMQVEDLFLLFAKKASEFNSWFENAEYDDSQIETSNCCESTIKRGESSQNTVQIRSSFKKLKPASKDK